MPVSLRVIERRLHRQEYANLSELESWLKRMVMNAKEYYHKNSTTFEDAERVRKATSNWMVKFNPAYKKIHNYAATAIPIPPDYDVDAELAVEDLPTDVAAADMPHHPRPAHQSRQEEVEEDAEGEDEEMLDADADEVADEDEDGDGDGDEDQDADADADEDDEADEDAEEDEVEADASRGSGTRIVLKRRGARSQDTENTPSSGGEKGDAQYSAVPYQGLNFQEAQEKIVDTLMRHTEEGYVDGRLPYLLERSLTEVQ